MKIAIADIKFDERGLVPAIVQDANTLEVLTLAYMNQESLERTLAENETWFWSRSRKSLWHKGETSGNKQRVVAVSLDCDQDALRVLVVPAGPGQDSQKGGRGIRRDDYRGQERRPPCFG